jgi:hypothetical protein
MTHSVPRTTHTVDMAQIEELNRRLADPTTYQRVVTADDLGLADAQLLNGVDGGLPGSAVLVQLGWDGSPEFPYIHGRFSVAGAVDAASLLHVDLHTAALNALAHKLGIRQRWGF